MTSVSSTWLDSFFGWKGKVALVTGSTAGLGRSIAVNLIHAGCHVIINGRNEDRTAKAAEDILKEVLEKEGGEGEATVDSKPRVIACHGDTSKPEEVAMMVEKIQTAYGRLDILVNNAGINIPEGTFADVQGADNVAQWSKISSVNLMGPMQMTYAALPMLKASPAGRVIFVSSILGHVGGPSNSLYSMTKAAILNLTKSFAAELASDASAKNMTVNCVSPGVFATDMNAKFEEDADKMAAVTSKIPMKRLGASSELAGAVLYLSSNAASYTTGTDICVDGGFTAV